MDRAAHQRQDDNTYPGHWLGNLLGQIVLSAPRVSPLRFIAAWQRRRFLRRGARPFTVMTPDGVRIDALHWPATAQTPQAQDIPDAAEPATPAPLPVVMVHGYLEAKEMHWRDARLFHEAGHDVLMFDMRGHGRTAGGVMCFAAREAGDLRAVLDHAQRQRWIGQRVITYGYSLGAATVIVHAADDSRPVGVIAMAPFASTNQSVRSFWQRYFPWLPYRQVHRGLQWSSRQAGFTRRDARPLRAVQRVDAPLLIVAGGHDVLLPPEQHAKRLANLKQRGTVDYLEIPRANHMTIYLKRWPDLDEQLLAFCRHLSAAPGDRADDRSAPKPAAQTSTTNHA